MQYLPGDAGKRHLPHDSQHYQNWFPLMAHLAFFPDLSNQAK
jgi:hypothetical protein